MESRIFTITGFLDDKKRTYVVKNISKPAHLFGTDTVVIVWV